MTKKKATKRGRPKKDGELKQKLPIRGYASQVKKILSLGFSSPQEFFDYQVIRARRKEDEIDPFDSVVD